MKAAVMYIEGTNCEDESKYALEKVGLEAEKVHMKQFYNDCPKGMERDLLDYDMLMFAGGWSAGDYVRAGAIFAARMKSKIGDKLEEFIKDDRFVLGVCNGFQILVEYGILPGFDGKIHDTQAVLAINNPPKFQCRPVYLRHENNCKLSKDIPVGTVMEVPLAHAEGRFTFGDHTEELLKKLEDNNQIVFKYCMADGADSEGYPWTPNGSLADIAGICNPDGNVLGMMPHPERVITPIQESDWTRNKFDVGQGLQLFESIVKQLK